MATASFAVWTWLLPTAAAAATTTYTSAWSGGTIAAGDTAVINDGATITGNVVANGTLRFNQTTALTMSGTISGSGAVALTNTGTVTLAGLVSGTGRFDLAITAGAGQVTIGSSGTNALVVGHSGTGSLSVTGGTVQNGIGYLGLNAGSFGAATVSSGTWSNSAGSFGASGRNLHVGYSGTGTLDVTGGLVRNSTGFLGFAGSGAGTATVTAGMWENRGLLYIGGAVSGTGGTGTLNLTGGEVKNTFGHLGFAVESLGMATVSGGTWASSIAMFVGRSGTGTLSVTGGLVTTVTSTVGSNAGSFGSANITGGTWAHSASLTVGGSGTGTLSISGSSGTGGTVIVGGTLSRGPLGTINLLAGGTLQIGTGSSTGSLATDLVNNGSLVFSRSGSGTVSTAISGSGSLSLAGGGTLVLSGTSTYSGPTVVGAGRLLVAGAVGSTAVSVGPGGLIGGAGAIGGGVSVMAGGTLSPGEVIESLSTGAVNLLDGSTLAIEIDSSSGLAADLLRSTGGLSISGAVGLSLTDLAASPNTLAPGTTLSLVNYAGAWNGGLFRIAGLEVADGGIFTAAGNQWLIDYDAPLGGGNFSGEYLPSGRFVNVVAVPEPSTAGLIVAAAASAGAMLLRRRLPPRFSRLFRGGQPMPLARKSSTMTVGNAFLPDGVTVAQGILVPFV